MKLDVTNYPLFSQFISFYHLFYLILLFLIFFYKKLLNFFPYLIFYFILLRETSSLFRVMSRVSLLKILALTKEVRADFLLHLSHMVEISYLLSSLYFVALRF